MLKMELTKEQVANLINSKPSTSIIILLSSMEKINIELSDIKTDSGEEKHRTLTIENVTFRVTEKQAEQLFNELEPKLFEETFAEIEDKYRTEKVKRERLEEEVEMLRERLAGGEKLCLSIYK